jgi:hypothetical protein
MLVRYVTGNLENIRFGHFLNKENFKSVSPDELRKHLFSRPCGYAVDVNTGKFRNRVP